MEIRISLEEVNTFSIQTLSGYIFLRIRISSTITHVVDPHQKVAIRDNKGEIAVSLGSD